MAEISDIAGIRKLLQDILVPGFRSVDVKLDYFIEQNRKLAEDNREINREVRDIWTYISSEVTAVRERLAVLEERCK